MSAEADFWRSQGYEWVEGGEGGGWQYTGRFPTPAPTRDASLGQFKIAAEGAPKTLYEQYTEGAGDLMAQGYRPSAQALPTSIEGWAGWTPTNLYTLREGGEGSSLEYAVNPYQETAKLIAAQPKSISPEELVKKYPSLAQLPKSTINAMAGDWRNVYGQMTGFLSPAKTKEGYEAFRPIVQYGTPTLSLGGEGELLPEFAKYVTYSPEYGVVVPQGAYRPYKEKLGIMSLAPMIAGAAALGPLAGALGGGVLGAAGAGAITGGVTSALTGQDVGKGILTGGLTGGFGAAASPIVGKAIEAAGLSGAAADIVKSAAISAGKAAITGGDPLQAALAAAVGTGVGGTVGKMEALKDLDPAVAKAIVAAASGAARATVTGGDPVRSALMGVADVGMQTALGALTGEGATALAPKEAGAATPGPVAAEDDTIQNILRALSQQDQEQAALQSALSSFVRPEDMQASIMEALSRQQTESDAAIAALDRATGQRITAGDQDILRQLAAQEAEQRRLETTLKGEIGGLGQTFDSRVSDLMKQGQDYQTATNNALLELSASQQELGGKISGLGESFDKQLKEALAKQELSQSELESVLRGEIGGLGGTLEQRIAAAAAQQQAEQAAMEQALRGEIGGLGGTFDKRLAEVLAQQEEEQAAMETALRGYDQRIVDLMRQGETEQQAMQRALEEIGIAQSKQQAATQQQIGGLGQTLGAALAGLAGEFGKTSQSMQQQIAQAQKAGQQAQQQAQFGNLLALLGMSQQQKQQQPPPVQMVGEIKPFEFSSDLLEGIYRPNTMDKYRANDQLLQMVRER